MRTDFLNKNTAHYLVDKSTDPQSYAEDLVAVDKPSQKSRRKLNVCVAE